jgi:hypothetical protein
MTLRYALLRSWGMSTCLYINGVDAIIAGFALRASARFWD